MSSSRKRRSSRRSRGSSPARRNDDLPGPGRAEHHEQRLHPRRAHPAQHIQPAHDLGVAAEEHRRIDFLQRLPTPDTGARSGSPGGGHAKVLRPQSPGPRSPCSSRCRPTVFNTTGCPPSAPSISVVGPSSANRSQRCHSEVMSVSADGLQPRAQDRLAQVLGVAVLGLALVRGFPVLGQQTDHRLTAGIGLLQRLPFHRSPGLMPVCGSMSRKISSASPGRCSTSHAFTATAWRLSRLE